MEFSLYLLVSLLCLYLHPWHIHVGAEMSRGNRLGTQQSEQAMLTSEAKQLYVDGIKVISLLQIQQLKVSLQEILEVTLIQEVNRSLSRR